MKNILRLKLTIPFVVTLFTSTFALGASVDNKVAELERIATAHSQLFTQLQQQLTENRNDINNLREQVDQLNYKLNQAVDKQDLLMQQFNQMVPESANDNTALPVDASASQTNISSQETTGSSNANENKVIELTGNDFNDYNSAVNLVLNQQDYQQAIIQFEAFIDRYPKSDYLGNAHYWLGQSLYSLNQKEQAATEFALVVKNFNNSPKSSDALLKIGLILDEQGEKEKAKTIFSEVIRLYPGTDSATKAQAKL